MKAIYHIYNFMERPQCEFSCIVGVRVAQSKGKITKKRPTSGHKQTIFFKIKYLVKTVSPRYLKTKQKNDLFTKVAKDGRRKLQSFETEMDAQACNVS